MSLSSEEIAKGWENAAIGTQLFFEAQELRVSHLRLQPGETVPPHRHDHPYLWAVLTDGQAISRHNNGNKIAVTYKAEGTTHFPDLTPETGFVHDLTNTGDTELVFATIEFNT